MFLHGKKLASGITCGIKVLRREIFALLMAEPKYFSMYILNSTFCGTVKIFPLNF